MNIDDPKYKKELYEIYKKQFGYIAEDSFNASLADKDKATKLYSNLVNKGVSMPKQDEYLYKVGILDKDPTVKAQPKQTQQGKPAQNKGGQNGQPTNTPSPTLPKQPQQTTGQTAQYSFDAYNPETGELVAVEKGQRLNNNETKPTTTTKQGVEAQNFETNTDTLAKEQEQRIDKLEQQGADQSLIAKERINLAKDYYRFSEDKEKRKLYDKNQDAFKFLEYQEKLQETATSKGLTVDDYVDNLEYVQAETFLDDADKEEFAIIQDLKSAERVLDSFGSEELKGIQSAKLEALKSRYKNFLAKRYEDTNSELSSLKRKLVIGDLSDDEEKEAKTRITYLENSRNNFFKTDEDKVAEGVKKAESKFPTLIDILPKNLSPSEKFSIYYQTLYQEHQELRKKIENGGIGRLAGEGVASTFGMQSQEMTRYTEIQRLLYDLAPIALINKAPVKGRDGFLSSMYQGALEAIAPVAKGLQGTNLASETNLQNALRITGTEDNVTPEIMQGIVSKYKVDKETGTIQGYKNWTREATGQTLGSSLGMMTHMIASAPASGSILPKLGATWNTLVLSGKAPTVLPRVYNFLSNAVKSGGEYAIAGTIFQQSSEELDFSSGVAGFVGESVLKGMLSPLKGLAKPLNLLFGTNTTKVVSQMAGRGMGEVGEETAQSLIQIYNSSPDSTARQKKLQQMFGTWDDTLHFAFQTFVMGAMMGVGSKTGRDINAEAEKAIASLPPEKRAILDKAVEAFEAEVGNATEQAVSETAQELEIEPKISENTGSQEQIVPETQEQNQETQEQNDGLSETTEQAGETEAGEAGDATASIPESETNPSISDTNRTQGGEQVNTDAQADTTEVSNAETQGDNPLSDEAAETRSETQQQNQATQETTPQEGNQASQKPKPQEIKAERVNGTDKVKIGSTTYKISKDKKGRVSVVDNKNKPISKRSPYYKPMMDFVKEEAISEIANSKAPFTEVPSDATPSQYYEEVVDESQNPLEVATAYSEQPKDDALFDQKEKIIADRLGKVSQRSFAEFGDLNQIEKTAAKLQYFSSKESPDTSIDTIAEVMSEETGVKITPQDIVEFITKYPSGIGAENGKGTNQNTFFGRNQNPTKQALADRFKELTGLELDEEYAKKILEHNAEKGNQKTAVNPSESGEFVTPEMEARRKESSENLSERSEKGVGEETEGLSINPSQLDIFIDTSTEVDEMVEWALNEDGSIDFDKLSEGLDNDFLTDSMGMSQEQINKLRALINDVKNNPQLFKELIEGREQGEKIKEDASKSLESLRDDYNKIKSSKILEESQKLLDKVEREIGGLKQAVGDAIRKGFNDLKTEIEKDVESLSPKIDIVTLPKTSFNTEGKRKADFDEINSLMNEVDNLSKNKDKNIDELYKVYLKVKKAYEETNNSMFWGLSTELERIAKSWGIDSKPQTTQDVESLSPKVDIVNTESIDLLVEGTQRGYKSDDPTRAQERGGDLRNYASEDFQPTDGKHILVNGAKHQKQEGKDNITFSFAIDDYSGRPGYIAFSVVVPEGSLTETQLKEIQAELQKYVNKRKITRNNPNGGIDTIIPKPFDDINKEAKQIIADKINSVAATKPSKVSKATTDVPRNTPETTEQIVEKAEEQVANKKLRSRLSTSNFRGLLNNQVLDGLDQNNRDAIGYLNDHPEYFAGTTQGGGATKITGITASGKPSISKVNEHSVQLEFVNDGRTTRQVMHFKSEEALDQGIDIINEYIDGYFASQSAPSQTTQDTKVEQGKSSKPPKQAKTESKQASKTQINESNPTEQEAPSILDEDAEYFVRSFREKFLNKKKLTFNKLKKLSSEQIAKIQAEWEKSPEYRAMNKHIEKELSKLPQEVIDDLGARQEREMFFESLSPKEMAEWEELTDNPNLSQEKKNELVAKFKPSMQRLNEKKSYTAKEIAQRYNQAKKEQKTPSFTYNVIEEIEKSSRKVKEDKESNKPPKKTPTPRKSTKLDKYQKEIKEAIDSGYYERAIAEGKITATEAKRVIESHGFKTPDSIEKLVKVETEAKPTTKPKQASKPKPKQVTKTQIKEEAQMFSGTVELEPTYFPNLDPKGSLFTQVQKDLLRTGKKALDASQRLARYHALRAVNKAVERFPSLSESDQTRLFNHLVSQSLTQEGVLATANFDAESYKDSESLLKTVPDTTPTTLASSGGGATIPSIFSFRKRSGKGNTNTSKPTAPFKLFDKIVQLHRKYNKRGKLQQKNLRRGIRGLYYLQIAKVELSALNDMAVAIHELSHAIDDQHGIISSITDPQVKSALIQYYKDHYPAPNNNLPENVQMMEGFAMFIQNYTSDKVAAASGQPGVFGVLVDNFIKKGGKYNQPVIDEFVADIEALIEEFQMLPKIQQIGSFAITDKTAAMRVKDPEAMAQKANREIFDRVSDFENMVRASGTAMTSEDVSLAIRTLHSLPTRLGNNLTGKSNFFGIPGVFEKLHQKLKTSWLGKVAKNFSFNEFWGADKNGNWSKLHDFNYGTVMEEIHAWGKEQGMTKDQALEEFSAFLIARRINFEYKELADTQAVLEALDAEIIQASKNGDEELVQKLTTQKAKVEERAKQLEETLENDGILESDAEEVYNEYAQEFKSMTDKMDTLIRHDLETMRDTGLITEDAFQELTQREGYVPFKRLMDYNEYQTEDVPMLNASQTGKIGSLKQRRGSKKPIINPFISAQANHLEIQRKAQIQRINQSLLNMATKSLDKDHPLNGQFKVIESPTLVEIQEAQNNKAMVLVKQNGQNKIVEFQNPIMGQYFFENITTDNQSFVEKMVGDVDRFFKASTTGTYVAFAATNFLLLDQATAFVNSRNSYIPIVSPIYNLLMRAVAMPSSQEAQYLKEYLFLSSGSQSSIEMYNRKFTNPTQILRNQAQGKQTILSMISKGWKTLMDALSLAGNVSELSVRGTDYILSRKNGKSPAVALEEAGRLTGSFHHRGRLGNDSATRTALKSPTYLTATLQHLKQYAESAKRTEKDGLLNSSAQQRVVAISAFYIAPVVANMMYLLQDDDEDRKRYKTFLTAQSPEILAKYVYLPMQLGGKGYLQIRVPDQYNFIANAFNLAMLSYATDRTYSVKDYYKGTTAWIPDQAKIHEPIAQMLYSFADKDITTKDNLLAGSGYLVKWFPAPVKGAVFTGMEYSDFPEIRQFLSYADKSVLPFEQQNEYTSPLAKYLATQYGESFSPKMFDKFLESVMGRTAKYFTGKETPFTGINKTFYKELWVSSAYQATEYFNSKDYWQKKIKSMKGKVKEDSAGGYISPKELNSGGSTSYTKGDKFSEANIAEAEELIDELYAINREFRAWQSEAKNSDDVASDQKARIILQAMTDIVDRSNKLKEKYRE